MSRDFAQPLFLVVPVKARTHSHGAIMFCTTVTMDFGCRANEVGTTA